MEEKEKLRIMKLVFDAFHEICSTFSLSEEVGKSVISLEGRMIEPVLRLSLFPGDDITEDDLYRICSMKSYQELETDYQIFIEYNTGALSEGEESRIVRGIIYISVLEREGNTSD
jgi:hypothetical protein